jgi:hypothetical protein
MLADSCAFSITILLSICRFREKDIPEPGNILFTLLSKALRYFYGGCSATMVGGFTGYFLRTLEATTPSIHR